MEQAQQNQFKYVGFWMRVLAAVIDMAILIVVIVAVLFAFFDMSVLLGGRLSFGWLGDLAVQVVFALVVILFWRYRGGTPGKMLISARIVDAQTGQAPSTAKLIGRYFAYIVSTVPIFLGFLWIAFDRRKQGWHDKLAGTVVVYDKKPTP